MIINIKCSNCSVRFQEDTTVGKKIKCPVCGYSSMIYSVNIKEQSTILQR